MPLQLPQAASGAEIRARSQDSGYAGGSDPTAANIQGNLLSNGNCFGLGEGHGDIRSPHHPGPCGRHTHAYGGLTTLDCVSTLPNENSEIDTIWQQLYYLTQIL